MDPSLGPGQRPRQRGHPDSHAGHSPSRRARLPPATKHVVLAALRRASLPQLQELHPGASERHSCPLRPRRLIRRPDHDQSMAAPIFGRMCSSRSEVRLQQKPGVDDWLASVARPQRRQVPRCCDGSRGTPRQSPLQKTLWIGAMAEASDDEDDAPMPDAPPEPEVIDMPPARASARPMSNLERCIALRLVYGAGPR